MKRLRTSRHWRHAGHRHNLMLVSEGSGGGPFICCDCNKAGLTSVSDADTRSTPKCVRAVESSPIADA